MAVRVGINGFGRIGRLVFRALVLFSAPLRICKKDKELCEGAFVHQLAVYC
jgi:glyceraldehyde-3-phosphate dehydrogenase/erythrose-4-phosphate dehydrogenase